MVSRKTVATKIANQPMVDVATLAQRMVSQFFSHHAALCIARDTRAQKFAPPIETGQHVPVLKIPRRDGSAMIMSFDHYLAESRKPETKQDFDKVWLIGALLTVGDALGANKYFGNIPEAEIIRHLRNGVAHGNRFRFSSDVKDKTSGKLKHPANIFRYAGRQGMPKHEVDTDRQGTEVLFGWGGADAIIDCLTVLGVHLWNTGHGIPTP
jgi:hypothetical protein